MENFAKRITSLLASGALILALGVPAYSEDLGGLGGALGGISVDKSSNGPIGASVGIGSVKADVGAGIGTSKGAASLGVDASVGGSKGINATSRTSVLDGNSIADTQTTASVGGTGGPSKPVQAPQSAATA
ncbi:hypothetical protein GA830_10190 [Mesorhizobium sp. NBSH29]|uniref:hypothetical protein n=1 Tax=Mesorhizobium sp. NBSH29 TaxID=2654249 RepID=UPI001896A234|nr:hypothetical protein [Mesorhizobium sp. NBSH29]QPC87066.1 hypothetical protein GA830_10190 [Mesorhizobium sp. NBSH29]